MALRRLFSMLLLAAFAVPLLTPLLAMGQSAESRLPVCCRRGGVHHCFMGAAERASVTASGTREPTWTSQLERCPYSPASMGSASSHEIFASPVAEAFYAGIRSHPACCVQTECKRRIALDRSRQKRGPPSILD